jgi:phytanoyl-CoA hydroxylase
VDYSKLAREFQQRGLLVLESFFAPEKTAEIERELHRYIQQLDPNDGSPQVVYEAGPQRRIRNIFHLHATDPYFARLAEEPQLIELVSAIFDDPVLVSVELFGKPAHVGSEVPYHQDNAYFNLTPDDALTCWVALADATEENGCVRYVEGSHRLGNLPHHASGVKGNSMMLTELPPNAGREVCGVVHRGGALIHHCNTIHRSEPNQSDRDRPGLLFVFKSGRCKTDAARFEKYRAVAALTNA